MDDGMNQWMDAMDGCNGWMQWMDAMDEVGEIE